MKIRAIPQVPNQLDPQLRAVLLAVKENLERLSGQRGEGDVVQALLGFKPAREPVSPWPAFHVTSNSYSVETAVTGNKSIGGTSAGNSKLFDSGDNFNTSNGRFTAPVAGVYTFSATYTRSSGQADLRLFKNDGTIGPSSLSYGADWQTITVVATLPLLAGEYVTAAYSAVNGTTIASYSAVFCGALVAET